MKCVSLISGIWISLGCHMMSLTMWMINIQLVDCDLCLLWPVESNSFFACEQVTGSYPYYFISLCASGVIISSHWYWLSDCVSAVSPMKIHASGLQWFKSQYKLECMMVQFFLQQALSIQTLCSLDLLLLPKNICTSTCNSFSFSCYLLILCA